MRLNLGKSGHLRTYNERNRAAAAVSDGKLGGMRREIEWIVRAEDLRGSLHTNVDRQLAPTMLLAETLLITRVGLETTCHIETKELASMWNRYRPYRRGIRFFPHIVPIVFPLIFPFGLWLSFFVFHIVFNLLGILLLVALVFFIFRVITLGSAGS